MANITRSAKSGNDWTENELAAYNICVVEQSLVNFFEPQMNRGSACRIMMIRRPSAYPRFSKSISAKRSTAASLPTLGNGDDPEPQVIAEAVAAFQRNDFTRERELHLRALDRMIIPAITMYGTCPTFYKITVTASLNENWCSPRGHYYCLSSHSAAPASY
ncbi:hypothetical protein B0H13DRAFT_2679186 [Mycena leptocephala]|nr:hypothetical protein B0H13DRAFT_2679186 [Mycena leptocephala]